MQNKSLKSKILLCNKYVLHTKARGQINSPVNIIIIIMINDVNDLSSQLSLNFKVSNIVKNKNKIISRCKCLVKYIYLHCRPLKYRVPILVLT